MKGGWVENAETNSTESVGLEHKGWSVIRGVVEGWLNLN